MKQRYLKPIAVILLTLMLSLPLTLGGTVLANDDYIISVGETKNIQMADGGTRIFQFTPEEAGFYLLTLTDNFHYHISLDNEINETLLSSFLYGDSAKEFIYQYEAGKSYYIKIHLLRSPISPDNTNIENISLSLDFLGDLESIEVTEYPIRTTYIYGYDAFTVEDYFSIHFTWMGLDVDEISEELNGILFFDAKGLEVTATFSSGETRTYTPYEMMSFSYDFKEEIKIGKNTLDCSLYKSIFFELDILVIENPVENIEIAYMPEIEPIHIDWLDVMQGIPALQKYFDEIPPLGTQFKINYTDGTSKIVTIEENDIYYMIDGLPLHIALADYEPNTNRLFFSVNYLGHHTSYTVDYTLSRSMDTIFSILRRIIQAIQDFFSFLWNSNF